MDVFDALISQRVYKPAFSHSQAVDMIGAGGGTHFDPDVAAALAAVAGEFLMIATNYCDEQAEHKPEEKSWQRQNGQ